MWKFDLTENTWSEVNQGGEIPSGRTGHTLIKYKEFLIMYLGILEVTKETEDMFVFHIPSSTWRKVDVKDGPINLNSWFSGAKDESQAQSMRLDLRNKHKKAMSTLD